MLKIPITQNVNDLQLQINICSQLTTQCTNYIDYVDFYNIQSYCKALRTKKEYLQNKVRRKPIKQVVISVNINELKSVQKLFELNILFFQYRQSR